MNKKTFCRYGCMIIIFISFMLDLKAQVYKELKSKKNDVTQLWGYENKGGQEYWWKEAHSQGKNEELMNWGMNTEWVISAQYTKVAKNFTEGLAGVEIGNKVGFIDKKNRFIISPQYEPIEKLKGFGHGLAVVKKDGKYGFINKKGDFVIPPTFDYASNFGDDLLATVKIGNRFGAIDFKGDTIVPCHYMAEEAMKLLPIKNKEYKEAVKTVKTRYDDGYYDAIIKSVNQVADQVNSLIRDSLYKSPIPQNVCIKREGEGVGLAQMDNDTVWILKPIYASIQSIEDGFYKITLLDKKGIVDAYGRIILSCHFEDINYEPQERLFIIKKEPISLAAKDLGDRVGLFSITGSLILPWVFESISSYTNGYAKACIEHLCTDLDVHGQVSNEYINQLLSLSAGKKGVECFHFCQRLIGLRPTCAQAHNNLGVYDLNIEAYKEGIQRLKLAHQLAPNDKLIAANLKSAKSDRKERRYNRVLNVLSVAGAVVDVAASTYAVTTGTSYTPVSSDVPSSINSSTESSSTSGKVSQVTNSPSDRDVKWMQSNYQTMKRTYGGYESQIIDMKTYPDKYNDSRRRDIQASMKKIRETILSHGGTCAQSQWETWRP